MSEMWLFAILFFATAALGDDVCPRPAVPVEKACVAKSRCSDANAKQCHSNPNFVLCNANNTEATVAEKKCAQWADLVKTCEKDPNFLSNDYNEEDHCVIGQPLVVGGRDAMATEYPFMALIGYRKGKQVKWGCGGTLISERWVMSAAHCTYSYELRLPAGWVLLGDLVVGSSPEAETDDSMPQAIAIKERHNYDEYSDRTRYHDIALYKLAKDAILSEYVRPACLHLSPAADLSDLIVLGWGATEKADASSHLQAAKIPHVQPADCKRILFDGKKYKEFPSGLQENKMLCGGKAGTDTCRGDSGGPAVVASGLYCTFSVVGITSVGFNNECGSDIPAVYTRISFYMDWIQRLVWPS